MTRPARIPTRQIASDEPLTKGMPLLDEDGRRFTISAVTTRIAAI